VFPYNTPETAVIKRNLMVRFIFEEQPVTFGDICKAFSKFCENTIREDIRRLEKEIKELSSYRMNNETIYYFDEGDLSEWMMN